MTADATDDFTTQTTESDDWLPSASSYKESAFELIPTGEYEVSLVEISEPVDGAYGPYVKAVYELTDGEFTGRRLSTIVGLDPVDQMPVRPIGNPGDLFDGVVWHSQPDAEGKTWARLGILVPEGAYLFRIANVGPKTASQNRDNPKQITRNVTFEIVGDSAGNPCDFDGWTLNRNYTWTMDDRSNLFALMKAAVGGTFDPSVQYGVPHLVDARVFNNVTHKKAASGGVYANLGNTPWSPPKARQPKVKQPTAGATAEVPF
jgi:hypothetical protein